MLTAFEEIKPIDDNSSGFNYCDSTKALGFKPRWNLGGDNGHYDFITWLDCYFIYEHPNTHLAVYSAFVSAKEDATKAYQTSVLYALELFYLKGQPSYTYGVEDAYLEETDHLDDPSHVNRENEMHRIAKAHDSDYADWLARDSD